jgi:hypothetical protein
MCILRNVGKIFFISKWMANINVTYKTIYNYAELNTCLNFAIGSKVLHELNVKVEFGRKLI